MCSLCNMFIYAYLKLICNQFYLYAVNHAEPPSNDYMNTIWHVYYYSDATFHDVTFVDVVLYDVKFCKVAFPNVKFVSLICSVSLVVHGVAEASASNETPDWFTIHHHGNQSEKHTCQSCVTTHRSFIISVVVLITTVELTWKVPSYGFQSINQSHCWIANGSRCRWRNNR